MTGYCDHQRCVVDELILTGTAAFLVRGEVAGPSHSGTTASQGLWSTPESGQSVSFCALDFGLWHGGWWMEYPLSFRYLFGVFGWSAGKEPNADWHSINTYCIYTQGAQQHILG